MKQEIKTTDIAIITNKTVEKTFSNVDAYLHSVIELVKEDSANQTRTYKVRTDLVGYKAIEFPILDQEGEPELDKNGNIKVEIKEQLIWLEQKQDWALQKFTYAQIDGFAAQIATQIPENLTRTQRDVLELQIMLLTLRKQEAPWGISGSKWRLRTSEDLLKDKTTKK